jgi:hypothetical protein
MKARSPRRVTARVKWQKETLMNTDTLELDSMANIPASCE